MVIQDNSEQEDFYDDKWYWVAYSCRPLDCFQEHKFFPIHQDSPHSLYNLRF